MDKLALFGGPPMRATLLPYAHQTIEPDDLAAVTQALASDWITQGPTIARFERAFAGLPCEYDRLLPLAREHGWLVIADAAHSFGGACDGRPVGALADMTTLSFHPAKLITTGEGGAVLTDRDDLDQRLRTMRHHGIRYADPARPWRYEIPEPGNNYRLTDFQSALGLSQLAKLDRFWERRDRPPRRHRERRGDPP